MNPAGHLAVSYLVARRRWAWGPVLAGTFLPDVLDKSLMLAGVSQYGRTIGHSALLWGTVALLWMLAARLRLPTARLVGLVLLGGASHLAIDLVDDLVQGLESSGYVFSAWFGWPWTNPDMHPIRVAPLFVSRDSYRTTSLELATLVVCAIVVARGRPR